VKSVYFWPFCWGVVWVFTVAGFRYLGWTGWWTIPAAVLSVPLSLFLGLTVASFTSPVIERLFFKSRE
jgi:hypothetical protein